MTLPTAVECPTLGRPRRATLTTLDSAGTKSTVTPSAPPGTESVAVSTMRAPSSVASSREAVLAFTPIRRASSLTPRPSGWAASASSSASARSTEATGRVIGRTLSRARTRNLGGMGAGGYFGRALVVDVADGDAERLPLPEDVLRAYIGGAGLGAWLMHRLAPPGGDPLAPEAPLAFCFSPLVGTPLTTSAKFAVVTKSPLTGLLNDALASSHFAIAGKLTGHDAIVVRGACAEPSVLLLDGDGPRLEPAGDLWGLSAADAERSLRERLGKAWGVASIRPGRGR